MAYQTRQEPAQRAVVLTGVFAVHVGLLLLVLSARGAESPLSPLRESALSVISIPAAAPSPAPPPPPTLPSRVADTNRPLSETPPTIESDPNSTASPGGGCATLDSVSKALLVDPSALTAILAAPPETRSVADAIVLWNEGWSAAAPEVDGPLSPVRAAVKAVLEKVDRGCLGEEIVGPRLIPIPAGERTTFIVIGSGKWSWSALLLEQSPFVAELPGGPALPAVPARIP